ncbi:hypothetical protein EUX98_g8022 [Antrodiella citrinella]|uniref:DUF6535 domain-containing protein n=1 Tax=Antrodiella citrinella TaxID=2447956 RepID=A0A4S4ME51_9APHY|nr:hypothetical protein EUX98_g8022 [Antrodiella citrinella]
MSQTFYSTKTGDVTRKSDPTAGNPAEVAASVAWNGPSVSVLWVQSLLYASLACSLFAALGSVTGRQSLGKYSTTGEHGTLEDRCMERQRKFDALQTWHFFTVLEAIPVLLQASLLLFGLGLSAYMWSQTVVVAAVLIAMNGTGALAYLWLIKSSVQYPDCPFYSPLSARLRAAPRTMRVYSERLRKGFVSVSFTIGSLNRRALVNDNDSHEGSLLQRNARPSPPRIAVQRLWTALSATFRSLYIYLLCPVCRLLTPPPHIVRRLRKILESIRRSLRTCASRTLDALRPELLASDHHPADDNTIAAAAVLWLLETSSDPTASVDTLQLVPQLRWLTGTFSDPISLRHLDFLLDRMVECVKHNDDGVHWAKFTLLGHAYLLLHVELLRFRDPHYEINVWAQREDRQAKVQLISHAAQRFLDRADGAGEAPNLLRLMCLFFVRYYHTMHDPSRPLGEFSIADHDLRVTSASSVYTKTLLYLGHRASRSTELYKG